MMTPTVEFLNGTVNVASAETASDEVLNDGTLRIEDARQSAIDIAANVSVALQKLSVARGMIKPEDALDELIAAERRILAAEDGITLLADAISEEIENIQKELSL